MEYNASWVKPFQNSQGLDHLGTQAPCINLYGTLLPGITNVTDRVELLNQCLIYLFGSKCCIYEKAFFHYNDDPSEISQLLGCVGWLFWDSGYIQDKHLKYSKKKAISKNEPLLKKGKMLSLFKYLCADESAQENVKQNFHRICNPFSLKSALEWLENGLGSFNAVSKNLLADDLPLNAGSIKVGTYLILNRPEKKWLKSKFDVFVVEYIDKSRIQLIDFNEKTQIKKLSTHYLKPNMYSCLDIA